MGAATENTPGTAEAEHAAAAAFIARWRGVTASELSTSQSFVIQLCELLGVQPPHPTPEQSYMFERPITFTHGDGSTSAGRIDCYRRGHFVWESKKLKDGERQAAAGSRRFDDALLRARTQAENYARALPAAEEAAGTIRWQRPDFQDPARRAEREAAAAQAARASTDELLNQERLATIPRWEQPDLGMKMAENEALPASPAPEVPAEDATAHPGAPAPATAAQPWPATLPEPVRADAQLLAASPAPLPLPAIEAGVKGKGPWKKGLPRILDTLEALGRARREGAGWRG